MTKFRQFLSNYRNPLIAWALIFVLVIVGALLNIDEMVIGSVVVLVGIFGEAFAALMAWIAFVPVVGPLVAKVLALPFFWLLNGVGYMASVIAIKRGYSKDVVNYRILTVTLLIGVTIGYILGKIV